MAFFSLLNELTIYLLSAKSVPHMQFLRFNRVAFSQLLRSIKVVFNAAKLQKIVA